MSLYYIGQPVLHQDMANHRNGWIAEIKAASANRYVIGGNGMQPAGHELVIVWEDDTRSESPAAIVDRYIEEAKAYKLEAISETEVKTRLEQAAKALQARVKLANERQAETDRKREAFLQEAKEKTPAWAKAVIIAEHHINQSDIQTDYFAHSSDKVLILAFSKHTRDLFPEMRKAAANAEETKHLVTGGEEHREKYSMGAGYYLKDGGSHSTGWSIEKISLVDWTTKQQNVNYIPVGEWRLSAKTAPAVSEPANVEEITVREGTRPGYSEVVFPAKPSEEIRTALKAAGFRWSRYNGVWYGKTENLPDFLNA